MRDSNFSSNSEIISRNNNGHRPVNSLINFRNDTDDETKIDLIEGYFKEIMEVLGLDLEDESLKGTPGRVARMYVKEIFSGLNSANKPAVTLFKNKYNYSQMIVEKDITLFSTCEHHFVPIIGKAHIAYYSSGNVIGLSKLNRIVQFFSKKPQLQEKLTQENCR